MGDDSYNEYFEYLKQRSLLGWIYRRYFLYPRIGRQLSGKALDFGCGIGDFLRYRPGTVGVDINPKAVAYCRELGLDVELLHAGEDIPFASATFDSVLIDNVIEHIPAADVDAVVHDVARVVKPGGLVVAGVPGIKGYHADSDHKVFYRESDLVALFGSHDFFEKGGFRMPLPWGPLEERLSQYCVYVVFGRGQIAA